MPTIMRSVYEWQCRPRPAGPQGEPEPRDLEELVEPVERVDLLAAGGRIIQAPLGSDSSPYMTMENHGWNNIVLSSI
jgi:hypothetical protein